MWTEREREELSVWADALQARGEPLGELITTSLVLEARTAGRGPLHLLDPADEVDHELAGLRARVDELHAALRQPIVDGLREGSPELEASWEHGMIVALRIVDHPLGRRLGQRAIDSLRALLRLPQARFLRYLRVDARERDWTPIHRELPGILIEPEVVARPWTVLLGAPPRHMRRHAPAGAVELGPGLASLAAPERGLRSLFLDTVRVELPWHGGDKGTRRRAAAALAELGPRCPDATTLTQLARALWDPSLRVRLQILDALPRLGREAAPLVPELLLVERGELAWVTRVREVLDTLGRNPALVEAVAHNFTADQPRCARWLAASPLGIARVARPRVTAMLQGSHPLDGWVRHELEQAQRRMDYREALHREARQLDSRSPGAQPLLRRIRRWIG